MGACTPLLTSYPEGVQTQLRAMKVDTIPDRTGQYLRMRLLKMLDGEGTPVPTRYRLATQLAKQETIIGIGKDATTRRMRVTMDLTYILRDTSTGKSLKQGTLKTYGSYNYILEGFYANTVSSEAVQFQILDMLSSLLVLELAEYFNAAEKSGDSDEKKV